MQKLLLFYLLLCIVANAYGQTRLYVATNGNDNNSGTSPSLPLRSLAGAQAKIRSIKTQYGVPPGGLIHHDMTIISILISFKQGLWYYLMEDIIISMQR